MKKYLLDGKWRMTGNGYDVEGTVPGSVYSFLYLDNKLLPDPHYRDNELIYTALAEHEYTFERKFDYVPTANATHLVFEGLDTLCSVYLNGKMIAETSNMHLKYSFDVSDTLVNGENVLKVVCHSATAWMREKNNAARLFGATDCMQGYPYLRKAHCMMGWDWGPRLPDAGIWRSVYLLEKNSSEITEVHVTQRHADGKVYLTPSVEICGDAEIKISLTSPDGSSTALTPNAENEVEDPKLWWPNGLGAQDMYNIQISLIENGETVDERSMKIGLRELKLIRKQDAYGESFYHEINGVDMFAMGADYIPEDNIFSRITPERTRALLTHCKNCNFNAIRVWGGGYYPDDFFFDICDELGLVVFFDLMFACSVYDPDDQTKQSIVDEVSQNLKRIRHHACLGLICGNNEIEWHFHEYVAISGRPDREYLEAVYLELFEDLIPKTVNQVAPYIAYVPSSPTSTGRFADPNGEASGDCHDWEPDYLNCRGRFYRYVSEFGFESLPCLKTIESFTEEKDRNLNSAIMERHQRSFGGNELILTYLSRNYLYPSSFDCLIYASQLLQAEAIRYRVEHWRRNRGRCMGALYWQLNDIWPVTSWASIDYCGRYKALQYAAKRFFSPILISCEEIGERQTKRFINAESGMYSLEKSARLFVNNDTRSPISGKVKWEIRDRYSNILSSGEQEIAVAPMSVTSLPKLEFNTLDPKSEHMHFAFEANGAIISEGSVLFSAPKHHEFADPALSYKVDNDVITVYSNAYASSVQIESENGDLILEDNFFDMEKGERRIRILSGSASNLKLRSVFDIK